MKKSIFGVRVCVLIGVLCGMLFLSSQVFAKKQDDISKDEDMIAEQRKALKENTLQVLKSKEWIIYVAPEGGKGKPETDMITFTEEGKVVSKNLLSKGYNASNFSLSVQDNDVAVWETMQSDENQNLAFLRGELRGSEMIGSLSMKPLNGATVSYYYSTVPPALPAPEEAPVKKGKKGK